MSHVTADQIHALWVHPNITATIERGEDLAPISKEDLVALVSSDDEGDLLTEDGALTDQGATVLADYFTTTPPGDQLDGPRHSALTHLEHAAEARDQARTHLADAEDDLTTAVRDCFTAHVPMRAMEQALGLTRQRVYQLRDGHR